MYQTKDFSYHLPSALIAQKPKRPRDHSRLLLLDRKTGKIEHRHFYDLPSYLRPGDLLVLNNSKVFPARLIGRRSDTGGEREVFLHRQLGRNEWECLIKGRAKPGLEIVFPGSLSAALVDNNQDGTWRVRFNLSGGRFWKTIGRIGRVPLPPYIKREKMIDSDKNNYQTVFADSHRVGSVAAPTAGLHFTKSLLKKIKAKGVKIKYVTLHVGLGTFAPVKTEDIRDYKMHSELASISASVIKDILKTKQSGGRVIAVGTTSCRTLESLDWLKLNRSSSIRSQSFQTSIFIYPGYKFQAVDALVTNFHLPESTLLMLVSALARKEDIDRAYQEAVRKEYRFFSYGDAMFIY